MAQAHPGSTILVSPGKILRDLLILVPLLALAGWGLRESGLLQPAPPPLPTSGAAGDAPMGTNPEVLAVLAYLDRNSDVPIARINGMELSRGDLDARAISLLTRMNQPPQGNVKPDIQAEFLRVRIFYDISREQAEEAAAAARGIAPTDAQVRDRMAQIEESFGSAEAFEAQLATMQSDREGMASLTRKNLKAEQLREAVLGELGVHPDAPDASSAYEAWLSEQVALLDVAVLDPAFRDSMTRLVEMFREAPQHGGHGQSMGPAGVAPSNAETHAHAGHDHGHDHHDHAH